METPGGDARFRGGKLVDEDRAKRERRRELSRIAFERCLKHATGRVQEKIKEIKTATGRLAYWQGRVAHYGKQLRRLDEEAAAQRTHRPARLIAGRGEEV